VHPRRSVGHSSAVYIIVPRGLCGWQADTIAYQLWLPTYIQTLVYTIRAYIIHCVRGPSESDIVLRFMCTYLYSWYTVDAGWTFSVFRNEDVYAWASPLSTFHFSTVEIIRTGSTPQYSSSRCVVNYIVIIVFVRVYVCAEAKEIINCVTRNGPIVPRCYRDSLVEYWNEGQEKCNHFSAFDLFWLNVRADLSEQVIRGVIIRAGHIQMLNFPINF